MTIVRVLLVFVLLVLLAAPAAAETISTWRKPDGGLHLGQNPPSGSVLIDDFVFEDGPPSEAPAAESVDAAMARAAADGREIIRRRAEAREREVAEAEERRPYAEPSQWIVVGNAGDPFFFRDFDRSGIRAGYPGDLRRFGRPDPFGRFDRIETFGGFGGGGFRAGAVFGSGPAFAPPAFHGGPGAPRGMSRGGHRGGGRR